MHLRHLILATLVLAFSGCPFWTASPIVEDPSDFDFGFVGTWTYSGELLSPDDESEELIVIRDSVDPTRYLVSDAKNPDGSIISFTAARIADDSKHAVIQIKTKGRNPSAEFSYVYALVEENKLSIWTIDEDALVKQLKADKVNSVIDRRSWVTEITADSDELLKVLRTHFREFSSEPVTYERVPADR